MTQRKITADIRRPDDTPWAGAEVRFTPRSNTYTIGPDASYPIVPEIAIADANGQMTMTLAAGVPTDYEVKIADNDPFYIAVTAGADTTLEALRLAYSGSPSAIALLVPAGSDKQVQYNKAGVLAATPYFYVVPNAVAGVGVIVGIGDATLASYANIYFETADTGFPEFTYRHNGVTKWGLGMDNLAAGRSWYLYNYGNSVYAIKVDPTTNVVTLRALTVVGAILSTSPTAGVGYAAGAGSAGTQGSGSGKATGITLNTASGQITMNGAALAANTTVLFTLTNSAITANDNVCVHRKSGGTAGAYNVWVDSVAAGSCVIAVRNITAGSLSEAVVLQFSVIKGAIA